MVVEPTSIGDAKGALGSARQDRDDVAALAHDDGRSPPPGAQRLLQAPQHREVGLYVVETPLLAERQHEAPEVARGLVHVRFADHDIMQTHDRVRLDDALFGALTHDLLMDLTVGRNIDDKIAAYSRLTTEAPVGCKNA